MDMPDMDKRNPKGRKLDKNGNPIVTKEELKKSGMNLRDFLNKERGLTRRKDAPATAAINTPLKQTPRQPSLSQAMDKPVGMKDDARRDERGDFPGEGAAKAMIAKAQEEKYGSGLSGGGKVKGYRNGGKVRGAGIAKRGIGKGRMC